MAAILFVVKVIFPPFYSGTEQYVGHAFLFSAPQNCAACHVDIKLLLIELAVIVTVTAFVVIVSRNIKP
jgi:hypothetical protein